MATKLVGVSLIHIKMYFVNNFVISYKSMCQTINLIYFTFFYCSIQSDRNILDIIYYVQSL